MTRTTPRTTQLPGQPRAMDTPSIAKRLIFIAGPLLLYFALAGRTKLLDDADTYWHIAVGRTMLDSGLSTEDHFSFTRNGEPWVANQWLAECILALADALGGLDGVLVLTVAVLMATYLALGSRWLAQGFDPVLTLAWIALILAASAYTLNARPHIVSIGLLGLTFALLCDIEDGRKRMAQVLWLVPLFVAWSNLHGGVLGGMGTLVLISAGWSVLWFFGASTPISSPRDAGLLWLTVAGCGLALLATPYGWGSLEAWLAIMSMSLPDLIIEHAPLHPASPQGMLVILLGTIYVAIFAETPRAWRRPTFWLPLVWFLLTCQRIRHAPLFAIVAGIAMADLLPQSRLAAWLERRGWLRAGTILPGHAPPHDSQESTRDGVRNKRPSATAARCVAAIVLILTAPLFGAAIWRKHGGTTPRIGAAWARPSSRVWPEGLTQSLKSYAAEHRDGTPIFNEPILGGYLILNFPTLRTFIDGRCELYGEPFLRDFVAAWSDPSRVDKWQKELGFRAALIEVDSPLRSYFDNHDQWRLVAIGPAARFYCMKEPNTQAITQPTRQ